MKKSRSKTARENKKGKQKKKEKKYEVISRENNVQYSLKCVVGEINISLLNKVKYRIFKWTTTQCTR